jgi:hypothetical protein
MTNIFKNTSFFLKSFKIVSLLKIRTHNEIDTTGYHAECLPEGTGRHPACFLFELVVFSRLWVKNLTEI